MRVNLRALAEAATHDPAKPLLEAAGDLSDYEIFHNLVLVATYVPPPKVFKGPKGEDIEFHESDKSLLEHRFQGKVGLVLKIGPTAFVDDGATKFGEMFVERGDWVVYRVTDGFEMYIRDRRKINEGLSCRLIEDVFVRGRVSDPSLIY